MTTQIIDLLCHTYADGRGIASVELEDGSHRTVSARRGGRAFEKACSILANTPISIPLWDETAEELGRLCSRVVRMRKDLLHAEVSLTETLINCPDELDEVHLAAHNLFTKFAGSLCAFDAARTVLEDVQASPEADAYSKSPIRIVIDAEVIRLACALGTVALRAGLQGIKVKPASNGIQIDLPPGGAPLKDPQWAAGATDVWVDASGSLTEWWLDFWPTMREMQDHPGLTAGERESLGRVVNAHTLEAVH